MAYNQLTQPELDGLLASGGIDHSVRNSIISYLMADGFLSELGDTVNVQQDPGTFFPQNLDPNAQVLYLSDAPVAFVATDPNLQVIVDVSDAYLDVTGSNDVLVATGRGPDYVDMTGTSGDDTVYLGRGPQTLMAGSGADSVTGGSGHDLIIGGSGDDQLLAAGSEHTTIQGGSGDFDTITGATGDDHHHQGGGGAWDTVSSGDLLIAGTGNDQWVLGGSGPETLIGGSGSNDTATGGSGRDQIYGGTGADQSLQGGSGPDTITAGSGGDTLRAGSGPDLFVIGQVGNDTVYGAGSGDAVKFENNYGGGNATITPNTGPGGGVTVQFTNTGQDIVVTGVKELIFSDQTIHLK